MRANGLRPVLVIGILASSMLACNYVTSLVSGKSSPSLIKDDFSDKSSGWGTGTDTDSSVEYKDGGLGMQVFKPNFITWSNPGHKTYQDVHMEVTVTNGNGGTRAAFGMICNQQNPQSSYYYLAVTSDGEYVIGKSATGQDDVFLTNSGKWSTSSLISKNAPSYRVGADCGKGNLTLYVNDKRVDSVSDSAYSDGEVGLFLWSGDNPTGEVTFDDFVMDALK